MSGACLSQPALCVYICACTFLQGLCVCVGVCVCVFPPPLCLWFWTEAAVGSCLARPPSHTEGLQCGSDVMLVRLLFVWLLPFTSSVCSPPAARLSETKQTVSLAKVYVRACASEPGRRLQNETSTENTRPAHVI